MKSKLPLSLTLMLLSLLVLCMGPATLTQAQDDEDEEAPPARLCHIANVGFMLEAGSHKVLIDAVLGDGLPTYGAPGASDALAIEYGQKPFDGVDLVFASHHHEDHFDAAAIIHHMQLNPKTRYIMTPETEEELKAQAEPGYDPNRVINKPVPAGRSAYYKIGDMDIRLFGISHGASQGNPTQNMGILITIGDVTVFHPGDMSSELPLLQSAGINKLPVDVLLMPYWYLMGDGRRAVVDAAWDFKRIIPMHMPVSEQNWMHEYGGLSGVHDAVMHSFPGRIMELDAKDSGQIRCIPVG